MSNVLPNYHPDYLALVASKDKPKLKLLWDLFTIKAIAII